ncbi:MAG: hypothetical protein ACRDNG_10885 [Gaiellaceae bacterium]
MNAAAVVGALGSRTLSHAWKLSRSVKEGIVGLTSAQASERPQTIPVPRGPNSHL